MEKNYQKSLEKDKRTTWQSQDIGEVLLVKKTKQNPEK